MCFNLGISRLGKFKMMFYVELVEEVGKKWHFKWKTQNGMDQVGRRSVELQEMVRGVQFKDDAKVKCIQLNTGEVIMGFVKQKSMAIKLLKNYKSF